MEKQRKQKVVAAYYNVPTKFHDELIMTQHLGDPSPLPVINSSSARHARNTLSIDAINQLSQFDKKLKTIHSNLARRLREPPIKVKLWAVV